MRVIWSGTLHYNSIAFLTRGSWPDITGSNTVQYHVNLELFTPHTGVYDIFVVDRYYSPCSSGRGFKYRWFANQYTSGLVVRMLYSSSFRTVPLALWNYDTIIVSTTFIVQIMSIFQNVIVLLCYTTDKRTLSFTTIFRGGFTSKFDHYSCYNYLVLVILLL